MNLKKYLFVVSNNFLFPIFSPLLNHNRLISSQLHCWFKSRLQCYLNGCTQYYFCLQSRTVWTTRAAHSFTYPRMWVLTWSLRLHQIAVSCPNPTFTRGKAILKASLPFGGSHTPLTSCFLAAWTVESRYSNVSKALLQSYWWVSLELTSVYSLMLVLNPKIFVRSP